MNEFSACFTRLRQDAGFKSAYQFYHSNGGRRHFPFTYVHYLRIEKGTKLPRPAAMAPLLTALRLTPGAKGCRELFAAYLRSILGGQEVFDLIVGPLIKAPEGVMPRTPEALRWMKAEHSFHLTPEQFKALAGDETVYWCSEALFNDRGAWSGEDLAAALGLEPKAVKAALKKLKIAGLARESSAGKFKSRWPGKFYTFPGRLDGMEPALKAIEGYWDKMYRGRGQRVAERVELVRAEGPAMRDFMANVAQAMDGANAYATQSKGEDTSLFLIEARIRKLLPF